MEPASARAQLSAALARVQEVFAEAGTTAEAVDRLVEVARDLIPLAPRANPLPTTVNIRPA